MQSKGPISPPFLFLPHQFLPLLLAILPSHIYALTHHLFFFNTSSFKRKNLEDNLEEMGKFLEMYNLPNLNHKEIENLNRLIISKEIESII